MLPLNARQDFVVLVIEGDVNGVVGGAAIRTISGNLRRAVASDVARVAREIEYAERQRRGGGAERGEVGVGARYAVGGVARADREVDVLANVCQHDGATIARLNRKNRSGIVNDEARHVSGGVRAGPVGGANSAALRHAQVFAAVENARDLRGAGGGLGNVTRGKLNDRIALIDGGAVGLQNAALRNGIIRGTVSEEGRSAKPVWCESIRHENTCKRSALADMQCPVPARNHHSAP